MKENAELRHKLSDMGITADQCAAALGICRKTWFNRLNVPMMPSKQQELIRIITAFAENNGG